MVGSLPYACFTAMNESSILINPFVHFDRPLLRSLLIPDSGEYIALSFSCPSVKPLEAELLVSWICCGWYRYMPRRPSRLVAWPTSEIKRFAAGLSRSSAQRVHVISRQAGEFRRSLDTTVEVAAGSGCQFWRCAGIGVAVTMQ